jgi:hypothetical protein
MRSVATLLLWGWSPPYGATHHRRWHGSHGNRNPGDGWC